MWIPPTTLNVSCYRAHRSPVVYFPMMLSAMWLTPLRGEGNQPFHLQRRGDVEVLADSIFPSDVFPVSEQSFTPAALRLFYMSWPTSVIWISDFKWFSASVAFGCWKCSETIRWTLLPNKIHLWNVLIQSMFVIMSMFYFLLDHPELNSFWLWLWCSESLGLWEYNSLSHTIK